MRERENRLSHTRKTFQSKDLHVKNDSTFASTIKMDVLFENINQSSQPTS